MELYLLIGFVVPVYVHALQRAVRTASQNVASGAVGSTAQRAGGTKHTRARNIRPVLSESQSRAVEGAMANLHDQPACRVGPARPHSVARCRV